MKTSIKSTIRICRFTENKFHMTSEHSAHITQFERITGSGITNHSLDSLANAEGVRISKLHCKFVFVDEYYFGYHGTMLWAVYHNDKRLHLCWDEYNKYYDMDYEQPEYIDLLSNRIVIKSIFESTIYGQKR